MNINDYTYHLCDRFILMFVAFVGLVGTSYILMTANHVHQDINIKSYSIGVPHNSVKRTIDKYTVTLQASAPTVLIANEKSVPGSLILSDETVDLQQAKGKEVASNSN